MLGLGVHGKLVAQPRNGLAVDQYSSAAGNDRGRGKALVIGSDVAEQDEFFTHGNAPFQWVCRPLVRGPFFCTFVLLHFCGVVLISEFSKLGAELKTPDSNRQALADQFPGLLVA